VQSAVFQQTGIVPADHVAPRVIAVTLGEGGTLATQTLQGEYTLTTTGTKLTEGRHYWEVELLSKKMTNHLRRHQQAQAQRIL
jgi:hypothetical protein